MSAAMGLGAFAQGLVNGYQIGDKMKTAEEDRETSRQIRDLRGLQINEAKRTLQQKDELDALRPQMGQAIAQLLATPEDETAVKNYNDTMVQYFSKSAKPEDAAAFARTVKEDKLADGARKVAGLFGRLRARDETAIPELAELYKLKKDGVDIDPSRTGYTKDGIQLGLYKTDTGEPLPNRVLNQDDIVMGFTQFMLKGKDIADVALTGRRLDITQDNVNKDYALGKGRLGLLNRQLTQADEDRDEIRFNRAFEGERNRADRLYVPKINQLKQDLELGTGGQKAKESLQALQNEQAEVHAMLDDNWRMGNRVSANEIAANLSQLRSSDYIKKNSIARSISAEGYAYVRSPNGKTILVPIPDDLEPKKKTK